MLEAAGEVFRERGCEVHEAEIEFTDRRYSERFSRFPMRRVWPDMLSVLPAQKRRATGEIRTPDTVRNGDYDLICIGSPTWWQTVSMPMRSFLKSDEARKLLAGKPFAVFVVCRQYWRENLTAVRELAEQQGGRYVDGIHFTYPGDPLRSMLSLTSYLGSGEYRDRYLGVRIPPTNVQPEQLEQARTFAAGLADRLFGGPASPVTGHPGRSACMSRSFDVSFESPASVEQIHSAFSDEDYWLARFAAFGADSTLDSLIVDADGTVTVNVTQHLGRQLAARADRQTRSGRSACTASETWRPVGDRRGARAGQRRGARGPGIGSWPGACSPRRVPARGWNSMQRWSSKSR